MFFKVSIWTKKDLLNPIKIRQKDVRMKGKLVREHTWSLLLLINPGFFFFFVGLGDVSEGECPFEECGGLGAFLFCAVGACSADPRSGTAGKRTTADSLCKAHTDNTTPHPAGPVIVTFQSINDTNHHRPPCTKSLLCTSSRLKQKMSH